MLRDLPELSESTTGLSKSLSLFLSLFLSLSVLLFMFVKCIKLWHE